jgi:hypothetical protein
MAMREFKIGIKDIVAPIKRPIKGMVKLNIAPEQQINTGKTISNARHIRIRTFGRQNMIQKI